MLQTMRHLAQSWLFKGLMLFLVVSFGIWGIGDIFRGNPLQRTVAKTGKVAISVQTLDRTFNEALTRAHGIFGPDFTAQQAKQMGLFDQTLDQLIERADIDQDVKRLGIDVGSKQALETIAAQPQFRTKDGKFDREAFRELAQQAGANETTFIDNQRKAMAQQQLFDALKSGGSVPQSMVDNLFRARGQKRVLDIVTVRNTGFTDIPAPDDKTLQEFYQQKGNAFMAPEYRGVTIARLAADDLEKEINPSDDDVKKEFTAKIADYAHPERRDLVQVVLQDEAKARQLAADANKDKGDLADTAKKAGYSAVPLQDVEEKSFMPALAKPVFALQKGQVSDPLKSDLGWHVVEVTKIEPAGTPAFDSVKDKLRATMKHDQAIESVTRMVNQLDDQLAAGHALEDIADGMKLRLVKIPAIDANGKTPDGKDPAELPDAKQVLKAAFEQGSGETSPVLDDRHGNFTVVRTDTVTAAAVPPLDQIKDKVTATWKFEEQTKRAAALAETIAKGLREGKPASSFVGSNGVEARVSKPVSLLDDSDPDLPEGMLPKIFKLKKGEVTVVPTPDRQLVLRLAELIEADPAADHDAEAKIRTELQGRLPNELTAQYSKYLRVLFPVDVDQALLDSMRDQGS
jgi:peptidyl-prolyl cis-trans isomerase D